MIKNPRSDWNSKDILCQTGIRLRLFERVRFVFALLFFVMLFAFVLSCVVVMWCCVAVLLFSVPLFSVV